MHYVNDIPYETEEEAAAAFEALLAAEAEERAAQAQAEAEWERTRPLRPEEVLAAIVAATDVTDALPDEALARMAPYFPAWEEGRAYAVGEMVAMGDVPYRCLQAHASQAGWEPDAAPSLWAHVLAGQDGTDIGPWVQPDSTNPYMKGDRVTFEGKIYESLTDNNVWSPSAYPAGWRVVTE